MSKNNCRVIYPTRELETYYRNKGFQCIAGMDESGGFGALAGPTVACYLVLKSDYDNPDIRDGKFFSLRTIGQRPKFEALADDISAHALSEGYGIVSVDEIDEFGDSYATKLAMERAYNDAVSNNGYIADFIIIDGKYKDLDIDIAHVFIPESDCNVDVVAAPGILARRKRIRLMDALRKEEYVKHTKGYDIYSLVYNFGYPVPDHLEALEKYGACPFHKAWVRKKYGPYKGLQGTYGEAVTTQNSLSLCLA